MKKMKYKVWCEFWVDGELHKKMESSASWFLLSQTGQLWSHSPLEWPKPVLLIGNKDRDGYEKTIPLLFTGLKDANKKEIYGGDIVKEYPGFGCEWKPRVGIVEYKYASFWLQLEGHSHILDDHDCRLEVLGNIYEDNIEEIKCQKE